MSLLIEIACGLAIWFSPLVIVSIILETTEVLTKNTHLEISKVILHFVKKIQRIQ